MPGSCCHRGEAGDTRDIKSGGSPAVLALGAGRGLAARVTVQPLPASSTLSQPRAWREWGDTDTDGQTDGMLCLPFQGQRDEYHGTSARTMLESQTPSVPLDSTHSVGTPGSPLPCTHSHSALPTPGTSHGCRREWWGGTAQPGTHSSVSSPHLPSHIPHPDAFQFP